MTNKRIVALYDALTKVNLKGVKVAYAIARNVALLRPEIDALKKASEMDADYIKFDDERLALCKKMSEKDAKGKPILVAGIYQFPNQQAYDEALDELEKKYPKEIKQRNSQMSDFEELLKSENKVKLHKVSIKDIPEDVTSNQLSGIIDIITD